MEPEKILPLYIGCDCEIEIFGTKRRVKFRGINDDYYFLHTQGDKVATQYFKGKHKIILILRPFSDIGDLSEEEQEVWHNTITPIGEMAIESAQKIHWNKRMNFCRSIGIDCDGLIDAGLALNAHDYPK